MRRVRNSSSYFLFMEQGTGKTPVAIQRIFELYHQGITKVMVFAPKTLLYNWSCEIEKFLDIPRDKYIIETLEQKKGKREEAYRELIKTKNKLKIVVVNYEKANLMRKELVKFDAELLVIDECHKLRNRTSGISKNIKYIADRCDYRLLMTGTPICNGYEDLYMQYSIAMPEIFGKWSSFQGRYLRYGGFQGREIIGYYNGDELEEILSYSSYRVLMKDCIKLPPIKKVFIPCDMPSKARKVYGQIKDEMFAGIGDLKRRDLKAICRKHRISYLKTESYMSLIMKTREYLSTVTCGITLTQMLRLHQVCGGFITDDNEEIIELGSDKPNKVIDIVNDSDGPVVIFCQYVQELEKLQNLLESKGLKVGNYRNKATRSKVYKQFQDGELDVILLQLKSGSVGLNLQISHTLIMYSWNFSADDYVQAMARIIRSGQSNHMTIYHLVTTDSIDEEILKAINKKRKLAELLDRKGK